MRGLTLPLILLAALTFLVGLGRGAITDADEAFYAEAAREMVESGDFVTPFYNYEPRFQKPILYYWLTAGTFAATGGPGEAGARLWAALSGIGLVLVTAACARRWFDDGVALLSGAIVATSFGYYSIGRMALPDLPLTFFITLAIWAGWVAMLEDDRHRTRWVLLAAAALGLGFLTKGPVGVIIPGLVVVPVVLLERRRLNLRGSDFVLGGLVFAAIALPWYGADVVAPRQCLPRGLLPRRQPRTLRHGAVQRSSAVVVLSAGRGRRPAAVDAAGARVAAAAGAFPDPPQGHRDARAAAASCGRLLPLLFYSLSIGKQPRYVLPVLPPLAMLLATSVLERTRDWRSLDGARVRVRRQLSVATGGVLSGALLVALAALLWRASPLLINVAPTFTWLAAVVIGLAGAGVIGVAASAAWRQTPVALALAAALTFPALQFGALSGTGDSTVEQVARVIAQNGTGNEAVGTHHVFVRNLVYYAQTPTVDLITDEQLSTFLRQDDRVFVVASAEAIARLEQAEGRRLRQLAVLPYFNEAGIRLRTLLVARSRARHLACGRGLEPLRPAARAPSPPSPT